MVAAGDNLFHKHWTKNLRRVLMLPAREILHGMTTFEHSVLLEDIDHTPFGTRITTFVWAQMSTSFHWSGARLKTVDLVVEKIRVALLYADMATCKSLRASKVTTSFW